MKEFLEQRRWRWREEESADAFLPGEIRLTLAGSRRLLVENFKGIVYFDESVVIVQSKKQTAAIGGRKLQIEYYAKDEMLVVGSIEKIEVKESGA